MFDALIERVGAARSFLFVPGNRAERFDKALHSGADAVVLDLEDSVPAADKPAARVALEARWASLQTTGIPLVIRINAVESEAGKTDLSWLAQLPAAAAIMVSKAESAASLALVHERLRSVPLLPLVESAAGYAALPAMAAAPGVLRLVLGHIDFLADTGIQCDAEESELAPLRFAMAMATRLNRLAPPVDGVTVQIGDQERLHRDTLRALRFGFGAKLCIHPTQMAGVHAALAPTEQELAWAHKVITADAGSNGAAVQLDGRMVDLPVVLQARRTLARAAGSGAPA